MRKSSPNIFQDFNIATQAVSFFIDNMIFEDDKFEDISFDNVKTNEKLVIKMKAGGYWKRMKLLIARYPLNAANNWIEANEKEMTEWNRENLERKIVLNAGLTIEI
jgi:hypothetical protein